MATAGGSIQPVKVIADEDLRENGGSYVLVGGAAQPVNGFESATRPVIGGAAIPVYVVTDAQVAAGAFKVRGGPAIPMADIAVLGSGVKTRGGAAIPVYVVSGSLGVVAPDDDLIMFENGDFILFENEDLMAYG